MNPVIELSKEEFYSKDNILRQVSTEVILFDDVFQKEVDDLIESFEYGLRSVGLAAPQIGIFKRFAVINPLKKDGNKDHLIIINPKILYEEDIESVYLEGCASLKNYKGNVIRRCNIKISYQDRFGDLKEMEAKDFVGRIILHEMDHLDGILYIDRMTSNEELVWVES